MKKNIVTNIRIILLLFSIQVFSQNLILNPNFEQTNDCIDRIGFIGKNISNWSTPTSATTDFFNSCKKGLTGVPENFQGFQNAQSGNNYVGFGILRGYSMEYIQGQIAETLTKGKKYKVSFYVSLSEQSNYAVNGFNFLFVDRSIDSNTLDELNPEKLSELGVIEYSYHSVKSPHFFKDKDNWVKVSKEIVATGNEKFIIIGDFAKHLKTEKLKVAKKPKWEVASYYYLDNVSLEIVDSVGNDNRTKIDTSTFNQITTEKIEINKDYTFANIVFDINSIELSDDAKKEIKSIYKFLKKMGNTKILISGHTDNIGTSDFNQELSEKRAKSVADFFVFLGFDKDAISSIGYGNTNPISSNETDEGRYRNRRVSFKIVGK